MSHTDTDTAASDQPNLVVLQLDNNTLVKALVSANGPPGPANYLCWYQTFLPLTDRTKSPRRPKEELTFCLRDRYNGRGYLRSYLRGCGVAAFAIPICPQVAQLRCQQAGRN